MPDCSDAAVAHALKVRQAIQLENYHRFFQLYQQTPNMGTYILDLFVDSLRAACLQKMCKSYKPSLEVGFVTRVLAFDEEALAIAFMRKLGCVVTAALETASPAAAISTVVRGGTADRSMSWNTKDSIVDVSLLYENKTLLM